MKLSPVHDGLELIKQTTPTDYLDDFVKLNFGGWDSAPAAFKRASKSDLVQSGFSPLIEAQLEGDEFWEVKWNPAPLVGSHGVALVREGKPVLYLLVGHY